MKRLGVNVEPVQPELSEGYAHLSPAEREHMVARFGSVPQSYRLSYKGYPGYVEVARTRDKRWVYRLGYGYNFAVVDMEGSATTYGAADEALDAAVKAFIDGRKRVRGLYDRNRSPMKRGRDNETQRK